MYACLYTCMFICKKHRPSGFNTSILSTGTSRWQGCRTKLFFLRAFWNTMPSQVRLNPVLQLRAVKKTQHHFEMFENVFGDRTKKGGWWRFDSSCFFLLSKTQSASALGEPKIQLETIWSDLVLWFVGDGFCIPLLGTFRTCHYSGVPCPEKGAPNGHQRGTSWSWWLTFRDSSQIL